MKVKSQLIDAQLEQRATAPTKKSEILLNTGSSNQVQYHDGSSSRTVVNTDQSQTLTNKTLSITDNNITGTASRVAVFDSNGNMVAADISGEEVGFLDGALSNIQDQIDSVNNDLDTHEEDTSVHGVSGDVVGTTDTQTLTNKTLTAPDLNGADCDFIILNGDTDPSSSIGTGKIAIYLDDGSIGGEELKVYSNGVLTGRPDGSGTNRTIVTSLNVRHNFEDGASNEGVNSIQNISTAVISSAKLYYTVQRSWLNVSEEEQNLTESGVLHIGRIMALDPVSDGYGDMEIIHRESVGDDAGITFSITTTNGLWSPKFTASELGGSDHQNTLFYQLVFETRKELLIS